ncbi:MAG: MarR family transcriptional regulator [Parvularculales bacterium]
MADLKSSHLNPPPSRLLAEVENAEKRQEFVEISELLFFAYRDFTSDPDAILADFEFGRAHHRIIHFVGRHPGISVAALLDILTITKQSLARVLKQLTLEGFIEQKTGSRDRRQRLLHLTPEGIALERRLSTPQHERILHALSETTPHERATFRSILLKMVNKETHAKITKLFASGHIT